MNWLLWTPTHFLCDKFLQAISCLFRKTSVHNDTLYIYITRGLCLQHQFPSQYSLYDICFLNPKYIYIYLPEKWTVAHYRYNVYVSLLMHFEYVPWKKSLWCDTIFQVVKDSKHSNNFPGMQVIRIMCK